MHAGSVYFMCLLMGVLIVAFPVDAQPSPFDPSPAVGHVRLDIEEPAKVLYRDHPFAQVMMVTVRGEIECASSGERPRDVSIVTDIPADPDAAFWVRDTERSAGWTPNGGGAWQVATTVQFVFGTNHGAESGMVRQSAGFEVADVSSEDRCTANGYRLVGDRHAYTLLAMPAPTQEPPPGLIDWASFPAFLMFVVGGSLGAFLMWLLAVRIRPPPPMGPKR